MPTFNLEKYQMPKPSDVDMKATKYNFEIFMIEYGAVREKVGKNRMPKMTQSFNPTPATPYREYDGDAERFLIEREEYMPEYKELHSIFGNGYLSIANPLKQDGTERRRQIFMLRYVYGIGVQDIAERTYLGKTKIVEESQAGLIQFCKSTGLLIMKEETTELVNVIDDH
jgi:hypothetical protein